MDTCTGKRNFLGRRVHRIIRVEDKSIRRIRHERCGVKHDFDFTAHARAKGRSETGITDNLERVGDGDLANDET